MTDSEILEQLKNSNSQGLEHLFRKYYSFLTRTAFYLTGNKQISEDLAQEVFVKIWDHKNKLPIINNLKSYLSVIIRNSALDYLDKHNSGTSHLKQYMYFDNRSDELTPQQIIELKKQLNLALLKLPPKCRLVFSLNRLEGLSNQEIADYLNISKRTVETQISKALKLLRVELANAWKQYFAGLLL